jgi:YfiR/HmsC-like
LRRGLLALLIAGPPALLLAAAPGLGSSERDPLPEYPVKAAFLYHFVEFVEWPRGSPLPATKVTIGVLGRDPFGDVLDKAILRKVVEGRTLTIRRFASVDALEACEILFISTSEMPRLPQILARLRGAAVLTVGEADRFARRGGMIGFVLEDDRVRLEVNRAATEKAGLQVSSKLLAVARLVKMDGGQS